MKRAYVQTISLSIVVGMVFVCRVTYKKLESVMLLESLQENSVVSCIFTQCSIDGITIQLVDINFINSFVYYKGRNHYRQNALSI